MQTLQLQLQLQLQLFNNTSSCFDNAVQSEEAGKNKAACMHLHDFQQCLCASRGKFFYIMVTMAIRQKTRSGEGFCHDDITLAMGKHGFEIEHAIYCVCPGFVFAWCRWAVSSHCNTERLHSSHTPCKWTLLETHLGMIKDLVSDLQRRSAAHGCQLKMIVAGGIIEQLNWTATAGFAWSVL